MPRGVFLTDGPSDLPLAGHLEAICSDAGVDMVITTIDPRLVPQRSRDVESRLRFVLDQGDGFDVAFIHRDAEAQPPHNRREEIARSATNVGLGIPVVPVVPVRMTEAWLLLDASEIRTVAGRPNGTTPLDLPKPRDVERVADPKQCLMDALLAASRTTGRRRLNFKRDFGSHRALLLQRLDRNGPVRELSSWKQLVSDLHDAIDRLPHA